LAARARSAVSTAGGELRRGRSGRRPRVAARPGTPAPDRRARPRAAPAGRDVPARRAQPAHRGATPVVGPTRRADAQRLRPTPPVGGLPRPRAVRARSFPFGAVLHDPARPRRAAQLPVHRDPGAPGLRRPGAPAARRPALRRGAPGRFPAARRAAGPPRPPDPTQHRDRRSALATMLPQLRSYLMEHWDDLPGRPPPPTRLTFLGQATGVGKVCYFVFVDDEKRPRYIAKAPRSPVHNADLRREVAVIDELRARLPSDLCATLPGPMLTTELAGHAVVVEPVLPGRPLDGIGAAARPLDPATTERQLRLASDWLIAIQRAAPHRRERLADEDVQEHFLAPVEAFRRNADLTTTEERYLDGVTVRARALA